MMMNRYPLYKLTIVLVLLMLGLAHAPGPIQADDIELAGNLMQDQFDNAVRDFGIALSYFPTEPPEPQGITGFDLGVEVSAPQLDDNKLYMQRTFENRDSPSSLVLPKLHFSKGLPFGFGVSGFASGHPGGNARLYGGALKYAILGGSMTLPALGVRAHGTTLDGVPDLDLNTYGADLSISKGFDAPFLFGLTPFAGYSHVRINGNETKSNLSLDDHETNEGRIFLGSRFTVGFFNFVLEADFAEINVYSVRANVGF